MYFHLKRLGYFDKKKEVKLKSKNSTGKQGELLVARKLKKLDNKKYIVINDMYLRSKSGKLTQIDHIVVSVYGLFVVEVKNFMGTVIGGEDDTVWTHLVGKRSWDFYNPLRQNDAHVKVIKGFLGVDAPLIPIVCFTDRTTLKVKTKSVVTNPDGLVEYIANHSKPLISESELSNIVAYLKKNEAKGEKVKQEHLEQINDKKKYYKNGKYVGESMGNIQDKVSKTKCPKCGSRLMLRTGNKGDFWGCDNFPTCKHTEQVK
jgi:hypothetical protein